MKHTFSEIHLKQICKRFGPIRALDGASLDLRPGEVHALLGQNGAGKSTLMKILFGLYRPDGGAIYFDDQKLDIRSPRQAIELGIGFVQQHFSLVDRLTVAENVVLGRWSSRTIRPQKLHQQVQRFIHEVGLELEAGAVVETLSVGEKQRVEILKALYHHVRLLILDEPTSMLAPAEIDDLFRTIKDLRQRGVGLVFISHKLPEVLSIADRITVLREGRHVVTVTPRDTNADQLAHWMIGREKPTESTGVRHPVILNTSAKAHPVRLEVRDLSLPPGNGKTALHNISFDLHAGEILGIAGVDGNGQKELVEALLNLNASYRGKIHWHIRGADASTVPQKQHPTAAGWCGVIPQDRRREGLISEFSVSENLLLHHLFRKPFKRGPLIAYSHLRKQTISAIERFQIVCRGPDQSVSELSGGNQQKLMVARALLFAPEVLIALNPTWGVDIEATALIREHLRRLRAKGTAILLVSLDLEEVYTLCDRFFVLYRGRIMGEGRPDTPISQTGKWMLGVADA